MSESAHKEICPTCSAELRRVFTPTPFHLKGGGWAAQGYHKDAVTFKYKNGSKSTVPYDTRKLKKEDK